MVKITSNVNHPINNWFPQSNKINPNGMKISIAKSIKGQNTFKHIRNLDLKLRFLEDIVFTLLNASIIPLAHLFLCLPKLPNVSGTSVKAIAFFAKLVSYPWLNNSHVKTISSPTQSVSYTHLSWSYNNLL